MLIVAHVKQYLEMSHYDFSRTKYLKWADMRLSL